MNVAPVHRYVDGTAYRRATGKRNWPRGGRQSGGVLDLQSQLAVWDLRHQPISKVDFVEKIVRELRIRCYSKRSIACYRSAVVSFLDWVGLEPHLINREHVRQFLDVLACSEAAPNTLALHLSAIRTAFDKFCFLDITLGLVSPRKRKRLPTVLSRNEIVRLLQAAPSHRDTLLIGLMYATGMRVSEVVRLRVEDIDLDQMRIVIQQGKGNCDRIVALPRAYLTVISGLIGNVFCRREFLFKGGFVGRHLSPRTAQRAVRNAAQIAGLKKHVTPHSLRHSYATHCFENGYDIRKIQKSLGHARLETTTIYVKVASDTENLMTSPLDGLADQVNARVQRPESVGRVKIHTRQFGGENFTRVTLEFTHDCRRREQTSVYLTGIRVHRIALESFEISFPPLERWWPLLDKLPSTQRDRIVEPAFFDLIQKKLLEIFNSQADATGRDGARQFTTDEELVAA